MSKNRGPARFDNAKTVVSERVGNIVRYNEDLLRMAATYGFQPRACWARDPESKGKVESNVKYVKRGFYYARTWSDLADLNHQAVAWCNEIANQKVHSTTGEIPFVRLEEERAHLKPLGVAEPLCVVESRKATKTQLISIEGNRYSVPSTFARRKVTFRRYEGHIELLDQGQVLERIELVLGTGKQQISERHYPEHSKKSTRASHPLQARFEALAPSAKTYLRGLSQSRTGHLREQMEKITALATQYDVDALEAAITRSVQFGAFGYGQLKRILERQKRAPQSLPGHRRSTRTDERLRIINGGVTVEKRDLAYYGRDGK